MSVTIPKSTVSTYGRAPVQPDPFRVVTFNTAIGNKKITTPELDFLKLPFYREIIEGRPNAPILAGQEIGPKQAEALKELAKKTKNFDVVHIQRPGQGNILLIPKRFRIADADSCYYVGGQLEGGFKMVKDWIRGENKLDLRQLTEPRMFSVVKLEDKRTGKRFSVVNTHLSVNPSLRSEQVDELYAKARGARKWGPVILAGDLNARTVPRADKKSPAERADAKVRRVLSQAFRDLGPAPEKGRQDIDWIMGTSEFVVHDAKRFNQPDLQLPGRGADPTSDHPAEAVTVSIR